MKNIYTFPFSRRVSLSLIKRLSFYMPKYIAFTLIELLIIIAIIAILISMFLPALKKAKDCSKNIVCVGNLKQIGLANQYYVNDYNSFLPNYHWTYSWRSVLNPYLPSDGVWFCPIDPSPYDYCSFWTSYGGNYYIISQVGGLQVKIQTVKNPSLIHINSCADWQSYSSITQLDNASRHTDHLFPYRVAFRHNRKTVLLYIDGHVRMRDMMDTINNEVLKDW